MMTSIRIVIPVVAGGAPRKKGVLLEVSDNEARLLIAAGRAERCDDKPLEVVLTESAPKSKRRGRPKRDQGGVSAPPKTVSNVEDSNGSSSI